MRDLGRTIGNSKIGFTWKQADTARLFPVLTDYELQTGGKLPWPAKQVAALHVKAVTPFARGRGNRSAPGNNRLARNVRTLTWRRPHAPPPEPAEDLSRPVPLASLTAKAAPTTVFRSTRPSPLPFHPATA